MQLFTHTQTHNHISQLPSVTKKRKQYKTNGTTKLKIVNKTHEKEKKKHTNRAQHQKQKANVKQNKNKNKNDRQSKNSTKNCICKLFYTKKRNANGDHTYSLTHSHTDRDTYIHTNNILSKYRAHNT